MAVKTVNAQGYDAVRAVKSVAPAANRASFAKNANALNSGQQDFEAMLNKAGDKAVGIVNDAQTSKSPARQEIRADKSNTGKERTDVKAAEESVRDVNEQAVTETKPASEAKTEEAKTEKAKPEETKTADTTDAAATDEPKEETADDMAIAQISDALMQIIEQIKELLGVSDEELLLGLERADLQLTDLLVPANMSKLLAEVSGEGNIMSLVTNEELYSKLQELTKTVENVSSQLLEELGLTQEEFDAALEKLKFEKLLQPENADVLKNTVANQQDLSNQQPEDAGAATEVKADGIVPETEARPVAETKTATETKPVTEAKPAAEAENAAEPNTSAETETKPVTDAAAAQETVTKPVNESEKAQDSEETKAAAKEDTGTLTQPKQPEKTVAEDAKSVTDSSVAKKQADATVQNQQNANVNLGETQTKAKKQGALQDAHERGDSNSQKNNADNFNGQPNAQTFESKLGAVQTAAEALARYTSENTQSILRQLADIVRVARNENLTQMEMQLHPASLGTVNVSLVTKGGAVTAQFTTQNEAVKAAVEAQAVQLINNLEAQGVKVEAVEVAVAGHQLEKNLDERGRNEQNKQEQEEAQRIQGSRRNSINLNLYTDDEEMLEEMQSADDATRIAMELMAANGNSMDLMA